MKENKHHSYSHGHLPQGCQQCVKGEKLVLFVTGVCPRSCYFCPLSDEKYGEDVVYANERKVEEDKDLLVEAHHMDAQGAGITGGDPLIKLERTIHYIKILKKRFGKRFHIHLYTSLNLVTEEVLEKLSKAGLDEIRFHPDLDEEKFWKNIATAKRFRGDVGIEIPLIPGKETETKKLIDYVKDKVDFINLNELEVADNEHSKLRERGFETKDELSYAIQGAVEMGLEMIEHVKEKNYKLQVHVCTAKLKDATQLANRIKRQAQIIKKEYDQVDEEGMLIRGALYLEGMEPGHGYKKRLEEGKEDAIKKLKTIREEIKKSLRLNSKSIRLDKDKARILLSEKQARKNVNVFKEKGLKTTIVSEYPTADQFEIEIEFLTETTNK